MNPKQGFMDTISERLRRFNIQGNYVKNQAPLYLKIKSTCLQNTTQKRLD